ncbi:MAG: SRPBCC family protein [Nitrosospira sp.]
MFSLGSKEPVVGTANIMIDRSPEHVFSFLGEGFFENYPKWSPEVVELESVTDGPPRLGTIARQVRIDQGRRSETKFKINLYEPHKRLGFTGVADPFRCSYEIRCIDNGKSSELIFTFELLEIQMFMRPFEKLIRVVVQEGAQRTVRNLKRLTEAKQNTAG